jgi:radical SAM superfamily enzyme YgiQ (UPF0313 family)
VGEGEAALCHIIASVRGDEAPLPTLVFGERVDIGVRRTPYASQPVLRDEIARNGIAVIEGGRGCPYSCVFCDQGWRKATSATIEAVRDELTFVRSLGATHVEFLEPTFNLKHDRLMALLGLLRTSLPGVTFSAEMKVELLRPEEIEAMSGLCLSVEAGLQSSSAETLKRIRRRENVGRLYEALNELISMGVECHVNTIYGLPGDTAADWLATLDDCYRSYRPRAELDAAV